MHKMAGSVKFKFNRSQGGYGRNFTFRTTIDYSTRNTPTLAHPKLHRKLPDNLLAKVAFTDIGQTDIHDQQ